MKNYSKSISVKKYKVKNVKKFSKFFSDENKKGHISRTVEYFQKMKNPFLGISYMYSLVFSKFNSDYSVRSYEEINF